MLLHFGQHSILIHQVAYFFVEFYNIHPPEEPLFPDFSQVGFQLLSDWNSIHPQTVVGPKEGSLYFTLRNTGNRAILFILKMIAARPIGFFSIFYSSEN